VRHDVGSELEPSPAVTVTVRVGAIRPGGRYPRVVIFFGFLVWLAAEIASFVLVAEQIGWLLALLILVAVSAIGPLIVRRVGIGVLGHTQDRLARGEVPTREVLDGAVVLIGGAMICIPGFVGDAIGLSLMIGPVRHLLIWATGRRLARRVQTFSLRRGPFIDARSRSTATGSAPPSAPAPLRPGEPRS
jgi:UPF0716 protein FxsA